MFNDVYINAILDKRNKMMEQLKAWPVSCSRFGTCHWSSTFTFRPTIQPCEDIIWKLSVIVIHILRKSCLSLLAEIFVKSKESWCSVFHLFPQRLILYSGFSCVGLYLALWRCSSHEVFHIGLSGEDSKEVQGLSYELQAALLSSTRCGSRANFTVLASELRALQPVECFLAYLVMDPPSIPASNTLFSKSDISSLLGVFQYPFLGVHFSGFRVTHS